MADADGAAHQGLIPQQKPLLPSNRRQVASPAPAAPERPFPAQAYDGGRDDRAQHGQIHGQKQKAHRKHPETENGQDRQHSPGDKDQAQRDANHRARAALNRVQQDMETRRGSGQGGQLSLEPASVPGLHDGLPRARRRRSGSCKGAGSDMRRGPVAAVRPCNTMLPRVLTGAVITGRAQAQAQGPCGKKTAVAVSRCGQRD